MKYQGVEIPEEGLPITIAVSGKTENRFFKCMMYYGEREIGHIMSEGEMCLSVTWKGAVLADYFTTDPFNTIRVVEKARKVLENFLDQGELVYEYIRQR